MRVDVKGEWVMSDAIEQVVRRDLQSKEKWKEFGLVMLAIVLFYTVYFLSSLLGYLSLIGYCLDIGVLYWLYRMIRKYSYRYHYLLTNGTLAVIQTEGRRKSPKQLCLLQLSGAQALLAEHDPLPTADRVITAGRMEGNANNRWLAVKQEGKTTLLLFAPDSRITNVIGAFIKHNQTESKKQP